jgi:ABC-2 type transport system permease protein
MNRVVMRLTARSLLGRRRALALLVLPMLLVGLAVLIRMMIGADAELATAVVIVFGLGTLMPLLGLIAGTGAIGPEIGDGSIIYILAKPLRRSTIILSKLVVAIVVAASFGVVPIYIAGWLLSGSAGSAALAPAVGALVAAIAYCALFLLLAVVTRNAVVIGLVYALVWESVVGQFIPGAQTLSVQQWSLSITDRMLGDDLGGAFLGLDPAVELRTGVIMLVVVSVGAVALASRRLRRVRLTSDE